MSKISIFWVLCLCNWVSDRIVILICLGGFIIVRGNLIRLCVRFNVCFMIRMKFDLILLWI